MLALPAGLRAVAGAGVAAVTALVLVRQRRPTRVLLATAATALVLAASGGQGLVRESGPLGGLVEDGAVVTLVGRVVTEPLARPSRSGEQVSFRLAVRQVRARGEFARVRTTVLLLGDTRWRDVAWQSELRVQGRLGPADAADPFVAVVRARGSPWVTSRPGIVARAAEHLRAGLRDAASPLPDDARGLLPALVIGDTSRTPADLTDAMLATGMTHLSAVSGSNVAIVLAAALGCAALLGLHRRLRPAAALGVLAGFVILARPEPSVLRAAVMGAIGLIGLSASRRAAGIPVLSSAVIVLLTVDPWLARSFGFALSTLATLGLLLFVRDWGGAIGRALPPRLAKAGPALAIPVAAQAMCAPVVVLLQGSVSLVGLPANLLAAPLVAPATVAGISAALAAVVWDPLAQVLCWLGALPALGIAQIARRLATVPGGTVAWPDGPAGALLLAGLSVLLLLTWRWWSHQVHRRPLAVLAAGALAVGAAAPTAATTWPPANWRLVACDVGQGDGLVLATTPGHAVVVDVGPDPATMDRCLDRLHVDVLDAVVLTHFHADHVEGLPGALAGRRVAEILVSPILDPDYEVRRVRGWAERAGVRVREVYAGDTLGWAGLSGRVWWPARRITSGSIANNGSVVLEVHSGPVDALLLGDVEHEAAHAMLLEVRRDPLLAAAARGFDVVKTPHHGSANLDEDFIAAVRAPLAIISVGRDNDYGHPTAGHLAELRRDGYAVLRTDQRGDIAILAEGEGVAVTWRGS